MSARRMLALRRVMVVAPALALLAIYSTQLMLSIEFDVDRYSSLGFESSRVNPLGQQSHHTIDRSVHIRARRKRPSTVQGTIFPLSDIVYRRCSSLLHTMSCVGPMHVMSPTVATL